LFSARKLVVSCTADSLTVANSLTSVLTDCEM